MTDEPDNKAGKRDKPEPRRPVGMSAGFKRLYRNDGNQTGLNSVFDPAIQPIP